MKTKIAILFISVLFSALVLNSQQSTVSGGGSSGQPASQNLTNWSNVATNQVVYTNAFQAFTNSLGSAAYSATNSVGGLFFGGVVSHSVTNFGPVAGDSGKLFINASQDASSTIELPDNATQAFPVGGYFYVHYTAMGVGGTVSATGGATVTRFGSGLNIGGQYATIKIYKISANVWHAEGDLTIP